MACFALINILWTQIAPVAFKTIGWRFYIVFVACCLVMGVVMLLVFPDTKNKPLEEIAAMFGDDDLVAVYLSDVDVISNANAVDNDKTEQRVENVEDSETKV